MKNGFTWALVIAGLLFALWFQTRPRQESLDSPTNSAVLEDTHAPPVEKPARAPRAATGGPQFEGNPCFGDCSEEKAGYRWGKLNGITDPDACTTGSAPFVEGCRAYTRVRAADAQFN